MTKISYSISCDGWGDGKSVCLWRTSGCRATKIARFQDESSARLFAEDFNYPLSDRVKDRLYKK